MAHFKRKKSKRQVRCTMCTKFRWRGNSMKSAHWKVLRDQSWTTND